MADNLSQILCLYHPLCEQHLEGVRHPEQPQRLIAIREHLQQSGIWEALSHQQPVAAEDRWILLNHSEVYLEELKQAAQRAPVVLDGGDTLLTSHSLAAARYAVGAAVRGVQAVIQGEFPAALALIRPPGHHAEYDHAMGFCLFNNIAIAAHIAIEEYGLQRIFILDWDVHHGNGTQHSFEWRSDVFYCSIHEWPLFPGTGKETEKGKGEGKGYTKNFPLPAGKGDDTYIPLIEHQVVPLILDYKPELVLISAGFDAHEGDPLANMRVTTDGFAHMTELIVTAVKRVQAKGIVSVLEGGYHLRHLATSVEAHVKSLAHIAD